jgi:hypothetical protein
VIQCNGMFTEEKDQEGESTSIPMTKLSVHSQASPSGQCDHFDIS